MNKYLVVIFNEDTKTISYKEMTAKSDAISHGDVAIILIRRLKKNEKLINFWQLWEYGLIDAELTK